MNTLIKYEIKKIITKKSIVFTLPLIIIFVVWLFILPIFQENVTLPKGKTYHGMEAVTIMKKKADVLLDSEEINNTILKYQSIAKDSNNYPVNDSSNIEFKDTINNSFILPNYEELNFIANVYSGPQIYVGHPEIRNIRVSSDGFNLYNKLNINYLNIENGKKLNSSHNYTISEKEYWVGLTKKIKTPFKIGYQGAWRIIIDRLPFLFIPILFICILVSQSFINDFQLKTIKVIFPTIKGRKYLAIAKLISAYLIGIVYYLVFILLVTVPLFYLYSFKGWDLPIQVQDPSIPYPWTLSQTVFIHFGLGLIILIGLITFILLISLFIKKFLPIILLTVCIILLPTIIPKSSEFLSYSLLVRLLPITQLNMAYVDWISYDIWGAVFNVYTFNLIIYSLVIILGIPFIIKKYTQYELNQ